MKSLRVWFKSEVEVNHSMEEEVRVVADVPRKRTKIVSLSLREMVVAIVSP